jgi:uracil-DNA glycosylase
MLASMVERKLKSIHQRLRSCRKCSKVCGEAVHGPAIDSKVLIVGQAPGSHEGHLGKPFAFTAGKTLFKWFYQATGADEEEIREMIYFSAVARCFPGKALKGAGDRPPSSEEIENCREFLADEMKVLKPKLTIAIGKVAIQEVLGKQLSKNWTLNDVVGKKFRCTFHGVNTEVIPLPHPSGVSRWPNTEPGKTKLSQALKLIGDSLLFAIH